jgi:hypothetical protein
MALAPAVPLVDYAFLCGLQVADQLDAIPFLCRFQYARTAEYLLRFLDPLVAAYTEAATPGALLLILRFLNNHSPLMFNS